MISNIETAAERHRVLAAAGRAVREEWLAMLLLGVLGAVSVGPLTYHALHGGTVHGANDFPIHLSRAIAFDLWPFHPLVPHPAGHVILRLAYIVGGSQSVAGPTLVLMVAARAVLAAVLYLNMRGLLDGAGPRLARWWAAGATVVCLLMESPRVLLEGNTLSQGNAFLPLQLLMGPTDPLSLPITMLTVSGMVRMVRRSAAGGHPPPSVWAMPLLVAFDLLLKPSLLQGTIFVLLPWAAWWAWRTGGDVARVLRDTTTRIIVPAVAVLAWQVWWLKHGMTDVADQSSIIVSPLTGFRAAGFTFVGLLALWLPAAGLIAGGRRYLEDPKVVLLAGGTVVGFVQFLLLVESGVRVDDGNVGKALHACLLLWCIESVRWTGQRLQAAVRSRTLDLRAIASGALVALFVVSGIAAWATDSFPGG